MMEKERDRVRLENKILRMELEEIKWREERKKVNSGTISSFREAKNESYKSNINKRRSSYENILDTASSSGSEYTQRPRSVGTAPGKSALFSSNASDPCIIS